MQMMIVEGPDLNLASSTKSASFEHYRRSEKSSHAQATTSTETIMLMLCLHSATALLPARFVPHREGSHAVARAVAMQPAAGARISMLAESDELLVPGKWTEAGYESVQSIHPVCQRLNHKCAEAEHFAIALLAEKSISCRVVTDAGADPKALRASFEAFAAAQPMVFSGRIMSEPPELGNSLGMLLRNAAAQQRQLSDELLSGKHVLLALLEDARVGKRLMREHGLDEPKLRAAMDKVSAGRRVTSRTAEASYGALEKYSRDLTEEARAGCVCARARVHQRARARACV